MSLFDEVLGYAVMLAALVLGWVVVGLLAHLVLVLLLFGWRLI